jgi:hypothetical protein
MKNAFSMSLNQIFTANNEVINYQSYDNLYLTCCVCKESVFFKKGSDLNKSGIIKSPHFSHYKDSGKNPCPERTEINTSSPYTDSEGKKQSLEKFHKKIQDIINEGITYSEIITYPELEYHIKRGEHLVSEYNIDINLWLSRFDNNKEKIKKLALTLYHNKSSESQCIFFSNIVRYLCVPANEHILKKILYYVFVFNKEIFINNDLDEVFSQVLELISHINLENEYRQGEKFLRGFNDDNITEDVLPEETNLERETVKPKMVTIRSPYDSFFGGSYETEVLEKVELEYYLCRPKEQGKWGHIVYKPIARRPPEKISISWHENKEGEYLNILHNMSIVAIFYLTRDRTIKWKPLPEYFVSQTIIAQPKSIIITPQEHILSENLSEFFSKWLNIWFFKGSFNNDARISIYPPHFVKLLFIFRAFIGDGLTVEVNVNPEDIDSIYKESLLELVGKSKSLKKRYLMSNSLIKKLKISHL